jgi:hypothetical protein
LCLAENDLIAAEQHCQNLLALADDPALLPDDRAERRKIILAARSASKALVVAWSTSSLSKEERSNKIAAFSEEQADAVVGLDRTTERALDRVAKSREPSEIVKGQPLERISRARLLFVIANVVVVAAIMLWLGIRKWFVRRKPIPDQG